MTSIGVAITSEGEVLPMWVWFFLCGSGFTLVAVVLPLWVWFCFCGRGNTFIGFGFTFLEVVLPT